LHCILHRLHRGKEPSHGITTESFGCRSRKCRRSIYALLSFPGHPGNGHLIWHFPPHPLCLIADAWAVLQQVVWDNYLLIDVVGALKMGAETPHLEVCLARMAYDVSRYELSSGLWDSSSTRSLRTLFIAVRRFLVARSDGLIGSFLATYALSCLERQKERSHVHMSPTFLVKVGLILPRVRARL